MSRTTFRHAVYYFDVVGCSVALLIALGCVFVTASEPSPWQSRELVALTTVLVTFVTVGILRHRAYTQRTPWLITVFIASGAIALVIVFSHLDTMVFIPAICIGLALLAFGAVVGSKPISQPVSRVELFKLVSLASSVLFGLVLLEALVRLGSGLFDPEIQQLLRANPANYGVAHPYIGHLHTPNSSIVVSGKDFKAVHHVDGLGFRNPWPWPDRAAIVVVGDSVAFGYGVSDEQAWPALLARSVPGNRVINLSLIGAGPQQYLRVFETFGVKLHPKLLLVGIWVSNDFAEAVGFDAWQQSGVGGNDMVWRDFGKPERVTFSLRDPISTANGIFRNHLYPLLRRSQLYNLLWALRGGWEKSFTPSTVWYRSADGSRLRLRPDDLSKATAAGQADRREFQLLFDALASLRSIAAREGAHTLMVLQPGKEEVYLPLLGNTTDDPTRALREAFHQHGIEYLDMAPAFRQRAAAGERLFRELDGHPNEAGYALMSQLVVSHLRQHMAEYGLGE